MNTLYLTKNTPTIYNIYQSICSFTYIDKYLFFYLQRIFFCMYFDLPRENLADNTKGNAKHKTKSRKDNKTLLKKVLLIS